MTTEYEPSRRRTLGRLHAILNLIKHNYDVTPDDVRYRVYDPETYRSPEWERGEQSTNRVYDCLCQIPGIVNARKIPPFSHRDYAFKDIEFGLADTPSQLYWIQVKSSHTGVNEFLRRIKDIYKARNLTHAATLLAQREHIIVINAGKSHQGIDQDLTHWITKLRHFRPHP